MWWHRGRADELAERGPVVGGDRPGHPATWRSAMGLIRAEAGDTDAARDELLRLAAQR